MPQQTWYGAAAEYLVMWMAMMVPMMLPSLIPMLSRYRRSVRSPDGADPDGLTVLVGMGYFVVWGVLGAAAYLLGLGVMAVERRWETVSQLVPVASGVVLLAAGGVQLTSWKTRQLRLCREGPGGDCLPQPNVGGAWRHGLRSGAWCSLCCGNLMLALLAIGMHPVAMAAATLAISAERLAPVPLRVARGVGIMIVVVGVLTIARV